MTLEILTSDLLAGTRHGFFTRRGGASSGIYAGLNCGPGSSDQREAVALNRARVAGAARRRARAPPLAPPGARHRRRRRRPGRLDRAPARRRRGHRRPRRRLSVLTADCAPVLFHDPEAGVIGAAHAGWRGALDGVVEATLAAMERLGARPRDGARRRRPHHQPARLRGRPRVLRPLPRRGGRLRALLRARRRATASASTCPASSSAASAPPASRRRSGSAPAPTPTPTASSPTAASTHAGEPDYGRLISAIRL